MLGQIDVQEAKERLHFMITAQQDRRDMVVRLQGIINEQETLIETRERELDKLWRIVNE